MKYKRQAHGYVWCDAHCAVHVAQMDAYDEGDVLCRPENWRRVYVETNDKTEEF